MLKTDVCPETLFRAVSIVRAQLAPIVVFYSKYDRDNRTSQQSEAKQLTIRYSTKTAVAIVIAAFCTLVVLTTNDRSLCVHNTELGE